MKSKLLYVLLLFLVFANAVLIFMLLNKPHLKPQSPDNFLINELRLSDEQLHKFEELRFLHREEMKMVMDAMKPLKDRLFNFRNTSINRDSITNLIGDLESRKEKITYHYFNGLRTICKGNQKKRFDRIIRKAMQRNPRERPSRRNN